MPTTKLQRWQKIKAFTLYYLNSYVEKPFCKLHNEWFKVCCKKYAVAAAPRGFAKSSIFMRFYPLYKALMEPGSDIVLVSSTEGLVIESMLMIVRELENNPLILADFGPQKTSDKWTNTHIRLKNGSIIRALGSGAKIRGFRPDTIIVDDIENDENVLSEEHRDKTWQWFWKAVMNTIKPGGQVVVAGTILHPLSFVNTLLNDEHLAEQWQQTKFQALHIDAAGNEQSNWPEQYPTSWLVAKRDMNPTSFEQEYMNNPVPDSLRCFHDDDILYYDKVPHGLSYTTTLDPAIRTGPKNDFTAIVTVGTDDQGHMYVVDYIKKKLSPEQIIKELFTQAIHWESHTVGIETTGFQNMLKIAFELEAKKRCFYPNVRELSWDKSKLGTKKKFRIEALQPFFHRRMIRLGKNMKDLRVELLSYPAGQHDDLLDALAYHLDILEPAKAPKRKDFRPDSFAAFEQKLKGTIKRSIKWH